MLTFAFLATSAKSGAFPFLSIIPKGTGRKEASPFGARRSHILTNAGHHMGARRSLKVRRGSTLHSTDERLQTLAVGFAPFCRAHVSGPRPCPSGMVCTSSGSSRRAGTRTATPLSGTAKAITDPRRARRPSRTRLSPQLSASSPLSGTDTRFRMRIGDGLPAVADGVRARGETRAGDAVRRGGRAVPSRSSPTWERWAAAAAARRGRRRACQARCASTRRWRRRARGTSAPAPR